MELKIRGVDPVAVAKIDELAKEKKMSRNEYLKTQLHQMAVLAEFQVLEQRYEAIIKTTTAIIADNTAVLSEILQKGE